MRGEKLVRGLAKGIGFVGGTLVQGSVQVFEWTGEAGEVFVDQVGESYDARVASMELASAQRAAKKIELRNRMLAQLAEEVPAVPAQRKGKLATA